MNNAFGSFIANNPPLSDAFIQQNLQNSMYAQALMNQPAYGASSGGQQQPPSFLGSAAQGLMGQVAKGYLMRALGGLGKTAMPTTMPEGMGASMYDPMLGFSAAAPMSLAGTTMPLTAPEGFGALTGGLGASSLGSLGASTAMPLTMDFGGVGAGLGAADLAGSVGAADAAAALGTAAATAIPAAAGTAGLGDLAFMALAI